MQKRIVTFAFLLFLMVFVSTIAAMATDSDFTIENGVLTKYIGSASNVTIPDGVTSIGERAFYNCTNLMSVTIPNSVTEFGNFAFAGCTSLNGISIPDSVTVIGHGVFLNCDSLTTIFIPSSLTRIFRFPFYKTL